MRDMAADYFHLPKNHFEAIRLAANGSFRPIPREEAQTFVKKRYRIESRYLLVCGRWEPRKNILRTLEAFAQCKRDPAFDYKLVFSGSRSWSAKDVYAAISELHLQNHVVDLGESPFHELPFVYSAAEALVFASIWESFGLPLVEAMACGTPMITSNTSAMPEIAGNAALFVDPYSIDEIAEAMRTITSDQRLASSLREKGLARSKLFTWEECAARTLAVYHQAAAVSRNSRAASHLP
jgi:glycosyltransferase involved in cell wall biosynthesis